MADILRKVRSADGAPGVLDEIGGRHVYLYSAHEEGSLVGKPGDLIAKRAARTADERGKPLEAYRHEELAEMKKNFWGEDPGYHLACSAFALKKPKPGLLKCITAQETQCVNLHCAEASRQGRNRCVFPSIGWSMAA